MADNPNYVRLAARLTNGIVADLDSGWSIAGMDVRSFPSKKTNPLAARFVRKALADGRLEPASQAEWEEVHDDEALVNEAVEGRTKPKSVGVQEAHIQREAAAGRARLEAARAAADGEEEDEEPSDEELDAPVRKKSAKKKKGKAKGETVGDGIAPDDEDSQE